MTVFTENVEIHGGNMLFLRDSTGREMVSLSGAHGNLRLGATGADGDIVLLNERGVETVNIEGDNAKITLGADGTAIAPGADCAIKIRNNLGVRTIYLDGRTGDITLSGADCAEFFATADEQSIDPGTVLIVDEEALIRPCEEAYDRRVAGIASGAGGLRPGVLLGAVSGGNNQVPVALTGRTYCKVDAQYGAIKIGDLLTTSPVTGHAMKAADQARASGAVIGKALGSLATGQALIPVLVGLQ